MLALVEVLIEGVRRVDGLIRFRGVFAGILEDDLGSARVLGENWKIVLASPVGMDTAGARTYTLLRRKHVH
jgi:hypothetical protein